MRKIDKNAFIQECMRMFEQNDFNAIPEAKALSIDLVGQKMFDNPLIGIVSASDERFMHLKDAAVIGPHFMAPSEWLVQAATVVSFFFPFTKFIKDSNKENFDYPSKAWLHARIEGQTCIDDYATAVVAYLNECGYAACTPSLDARLASDTGMQRSAKARTSHVAHYTSNWSERHVAHLCGLGTFGLSAGLITDRGVAGRLTSVITEAVIDPTERRYARYDENCIMCGKCIGHCPVQAISFETGKDHARCARFLDYVFSKDAPRYACGKCQVGVPCESVNPRSERRAQKA